MPCFIEMSNQNQVACTWCIENGIPPFMATGNSWHSDAASCQNRFFADWLVRSDLNREVMELFRRRELVDAFVALRERLAMVEALAEERGRQMLSLRAENARLKRELAAAGPSAKVEIKAEPKIKVESP